MMMRCVLLPVLLLMPSAGFAFSGGHSHYFYSTLIYNSSFVLSSFKSTRTIDDITLFHFTSDDGVVERRVPWFKAANTSLWGASIDEHRFRRVMQNILYAVMVYLNDTEGYHILQNIDGCALLPNGTVHLIRKYHYNGKPLMVFDWETRTWIAGLSEHENMVEDLFRNITIAEEVKNMSLKECIPHIKELLELGKFTFDKKVAPIVRVTQIPIDNDEVRVNCQAYGHYPKNIFMMWYKNGHRMSEEMMKRVILPIPGLTYLTSLSFNVTSVDDEIYTCRVNHSTMHRDFTQHWRISGHYENLSDLSYIPFIGGVIAICLAVILIVVLIMFGVVSFARNKRQ